MSPPRRGPSTLSEKTSPTRGQTRGAEASLPHEAGWILTPDGVVVVPSWWWGGMEKLCQPSVAPGHGWGGGVGLPKHLGVFSGSGGRLSPSSRVVPHGSAGQGATPVALRKVSPPSSHHPPTVWSRPGVLEGVDLVWPPWWGKRGWPMSKAPGKWRSQLAVTAGATGGHWWLPAQHFTGSFSHRLSAGGLTPRVPPGGHQPWWVFTLGSNPGSSSSPVSRGVLVKVPTGTSATWPWSFGPRGHGGLGHMFMVNMSVKLW